MANHPYLNILSGDLIRSENIKNLLKNNAKMDVHFFYDDPDPFVFSKMHFEGKGSNGLESFIIYDEDAIGGIIFGIDL